MEHRVTTAWVTWLSRSLRPVLDRPCVACGQGSAARFLCARCRDDSGIGTSLHEHSIPFRSGMLAVRAVGLYWTRSGKTPSPVARLLHRFKYARERAAGRALAHILANYAAPALEGRLSALVPVPLHRNRLRSRGFNQAAWLARALARRESITVAPDLLRRPQDDAPRPGRTGRERRELAAPLFVAQRLVVPDRHVVLVDDVCTTGATLTAAANALAVHRIAVDGAVVLLLADRDRLEDTALSSDERR